MYCAHCGASITGNTSFCPSCGTKIGLPEAPPKRFPWVKWLAVLLFVLFLILAIFYIASKDLTESVEGQLKALRSNRLTEAYYSFTSKQFQGTTSLEKFRDFIKSHPQFLKNQSFQFTSSSFDNDILTLRGTLISQEKEALDVEYKLIDENGDWKILSIELLKPEQSVNRVIKQGDFQSLIKNQLKLIKARDLQKAYAQTVSKKFQNEIPYNAFEQSLKAYPFLFDFETIDFKSLNLTRERPKILAIISNGKGRYPVEYELERENGEWRIWSMRLTPVAAVAPEVTKIRDLKSVINEQLIALASGNINKAYRLTSKEFQLNTPLKLFESYIEEFPLLAKHDSVSFGESLIEKEVGVIEVELQQAGKAMKIDYALKLEQGLWKIWGMQINQTVQKGELVSS